MMMLEFLINGALERIDVAHLTVAGWTGRDGDAIAHHIKELAAIGVPPPSKTPLYYRASANLLTQARAIEVVGKETSGEVEPLIIAHRGERYLGLASDHTDRALEAHSIALSKQICAKPCARELWPWADVADHLEAIEMESQIEINGSWAPYQRGTLAQLLPLENLIAGSALEALASDGAHAMLCGTFAAMGGVRPARRFRMVMRDPLARREITHDYETRTLPVVA